MVVRERTEAGKKAAEARKQVLIQGHYDRLLREIQDDLYHFDRQTEFGQSFYNLISGRSAGDSLDDVDSKALETLADHLRYIAVFYHVKFEPLDVIRRVWGPFDHTGDSSIEEIRRFLFHFAQKCRSERWGKRRTVPLDERQEMIDTFSLIFAPLDRADACLQTPSSRLQILKRLKSIHRHATGSGWNIPLSKAMIKRFAKLDELIDKLAMAQRVVEMEE